MTTMFNGASVLQVTTGFQTTHTTNPVATDDLFTVTGLVKIQYLFGIVGTVVEVKANAVKLQVDPTPAGPATADLCATLDLTGAAAHSVLSIDGVAANALIKTGNYCLPASMFDPGKLLVKDAVIETVGADSSTGSITWYCGWVPLSTNATVADAP